MAKTLLTNEDLDAVSGGRNGGGGGTRFAFFQGNAVAVGNAGGEGNLNTGGNSAAGGGAVFGGINFPPPGDDED